MKKTLQKLFILLCSVVVLTGTIGAVFAEPAEEESMSAYLLPNEMVPFTEESKYVQFAAEFCEGITDQEAQESDTTEGLNHQHHHIS